jgi:hypothetical protein
MSCPLRQVLRIRNVKIDVPLSRLNILARSAEIPWNAVTLVLLLGGYHRENKCSSSNNHVAINDRCAMWADKVQYVGSANNRVVY